MENDRLYHQVGGLFATASAIMIPIGQTQSIAKGLTDFAVGEVGGFAVSQVGYHGAKLLGGSEADAQRASFVGSLLGGYAASPVVSKFSLNNPGVNDVTRMRSPYRQQVLKNIEESKLAREFSNFNTYLKNERFTKKVIQTDYIQLSENLGEDLLERDIKL